MVTNDIHQAIRINDISSFEALVLTKLHKLNEFRQNLLHEAIARKRDDISLRLIALNININQQDYRGHTPLHFAAEHGSIAVVRALVEKDVDLTLQDKWGNQDFGLQRLMHEKTTIL